MRRIGCLKVAFVPANGLAVLCAVALLAAEQLDWRDLGDHQAIETRVGADLITNKCCWKSRRVSCLANTAFQCRLDATCSYGQEIQGSCINADCNTNQQGYQCGLINNLARKVDLCIVLELETPNPCPENEGK